MVLATLWKFPSELQKSNMLSDNVYFEWFEGLLKRTVLPPTPARQLGIHLCSQNFLSVLCIFILTDSVTWKRCCWKALKVTTVREEMWLKSHCTISRIVIATLKFLLLACIWGHVEQQQQKQNNMVLTTRIKSPKQGTVTAVYAYHLMVVGKQKTWNCLSSIQSTLFFTLALSSWMISNTA